MHDRVDLHVPGDSQDFDFLLGEWSIAVSMPGRESRPLRGSWSARPLHGGRIVADDIVLVGDGGAVVRSMATLRTWIPEAGRWEATFLYSHEPWSPVALTGGRVDDEIHLTARNERTSEIAHVRFFAITASSFRWEQRGGDGSLAVAISADRGALGRPPD